MGTYDDWIGREERLSDVATAAPAYLLAATLDREELAFAAGDPLPPVWHWLYFLSAVRTRDVGPDGHPPRGGFLPPVPLPRRMRAGGQLKFERPIHIGDALERHSKIVGVSEKSGSSGPLVFVRVQHDVYANGALAVVEEESLVYRGATPPGQAPATAAAPPQASEPKPGESRYPTSAVMLFRVSALTFNGHRIHYDNDYAKNEEGYPDRVVHGPLLALMMMEHLHKKHPASMCRSFAYRAMAPVFCGEDVTVSDAAGAEAGQLRVVARNGSGADAVSGEAQYAA
jgi:3-methylfumaryl-CoA hydratase